MTVGGERLMRRDFQYAWRQVRLHPAFAALVLVAFALGIGANTAVFSIINSEYLQPLPVPRAGQIYELQNDFGRHPSGIELLSIHQPPSPLFSYMEFAALRDAEASRAGLCAVTTASVVLGVAQREWVRAQLVSGNYFSVLQVRPFLGRLISGEDNAGLSGRPVAVLRYDYWRSHFGGARNIIGKTLTVNGAPLAIVGVAPRGFYGVDKFSVPEFWVPLRFQAVMKHVGTDESGDSFFGPAHGDEPWASQPGMFWLHPYARVRRGTAKELASAGSVVAARSFLHFAASGNRMRAELRNYRLSLAASARGYAEVDPNQLRAIELLFAMVGLVLLIACCNVALLFLARGLRQQHQLAIRLSLGAGRTALFRELLAESLLLGGAGAGLSLIFAAAAHGWLERALLLSLPSGMGSLGWRVWAFAGLAAVVAIVLTSTIPAWRFRRIQPWHALQAGDAAQKTADRLMLGRGLTLAQVALALLMLLAVGLLGRTVQRLWSFNPGYRTRAVLGARIEPTVAGFKANQWPQFNHELLQRIGALPGVAAVGLAANGVLNHSISISGFAIAPHGGRGMQAAQVEEDTISRGYLATLGVPLLRGRWFAASDGPKTPQVVLVNRAFARQFLPGKSPIGATLGYNAAATEFHIIGVVGDMRANSIRRSAPPMVFHYLSQNQGPVENLVVRCRMAPGAVASEVRRALNGTAPGMPVLGLMTLEAHIRNAARGAQYLAELCGALALLATVLACLGLGGILAYGVARRRHEIGLRMALGARPRDIFRMILRQAGGLVAMGLAIGAALAAWLAPFLRSFLFGVSAWDPTAWLGAIGVLAVIAGVAAVGPALDAVHIDPMDQLRRE